ncbi:MAG: sortase [Caldilineaceae bacterium]
MVFAGFALLLTACGQSFAFGSRASASPAQPAPPMQAPLHVPHLQMGAQQPSQPDRLMLPTIKLDTPVVELGWSTSQEADGRILSEWDVAAYAAGWHKNSARLGEVGNVVMSGHNNILGSVFRQLDQLKRGDEVLAWAGNQEYEYTVDQVMIVPEKYATYDQRVANARWIGPFDDQRLTLVSCWPRDDNTHRIIVVARLKGEIR